MGTIPINYLAAFPINYADGSTPTDNMVLYYTPANNGTYQTPQWPNANIQGGWFDARAMANGDHHMIVIDTNTGNLNERSKLFPVGSKKTPRVCISTSALKSID